MELGDTLQKHMERKDITAAKLGRKAGVSKTYMWQLLHQDKSPSAEILDNIAQVLETTVDDLLHPAKSINELLTEEHEGIWYGMSAMMRDSGLKSEEIAERAGLPLDTVVSLKAGEMGIEVFVSMDRIAKVCGGIGLRVELLKSIPRGVKYYVIW